MNRPGAILGSAAFLALAPGTVAVLVPWWISRWHIQPPLLGWTAFRVVGALLVLAGLPVLLDSFGRFTLQGLGTPAPVAPTEHLVVSGLYRYVRNPMYVAVVAMNPGPGAVLRKSSCAGVRPGGLADNAPVRRLLRRADAAETSQEILLSRKLTEFLPPLFMRRPDAFLVHEVGQT